MKTLGCFLFLGVFALMSAVLLPIDLALAWVISWFLVRSEKEAIGASFIGGLLVDLFSFGRIGSSSVAFLSVLLVLSVGMRLQRPVTFILMLPPLGILFLLFNWLSTFLIWHTVAFDIPWRRLIGDMTATLFFLFIFVYFIGTREKEPLKLRI